MFFLTTLISFIQYTQIIFLYTQIINLSTKFILRRSLRNCWQGGGTWAVLGSLFELGDVHVIGHVTRHGPHCRYLQGRASSVASSSQSIIYIISHQTSHRSDTKLSRAFANPQVVYLRRDILAIFTNLWAREVIVIYRIVSCFNKA